MTTSCGMSLGLCAGVALLLSTHTALSSAQDETVPAKAVQRIAAKIVNLDECKPTYSQQSIQAGETGTTVLRLHVSSDGKLLDATVTRSSGFERLDRATVSALSRCRYAPGSVDGVPTDTNTTIAYNWRLESAPTFDASSCLKVDYPPESIRAEEQGTTVLRLWANASREVVRVELASSSGSPHLDAAAIASAQRCKVAINATSPGQTILGPVRVEYRWVLSDEAPPGPVEPLVPVAPDPYRPF